MEFTEQQISAVARVLSDRAAGDCGVHKEDNWDIHSENYIEDAKAALAALSAAPQVVADEKWVSAVQAQEPVAAKPVGRVWKCREDHFLYAKLDGGIAASGAVKLGDILYTAAPVQPVAVPDGWKLVPVDPTEAMMDAAEACSNDWPRTTWEKAMKAMIDAAPAAPAAQGDDHVLTRTELAAYRKMAYDEGVSVGAAQVNAMIESNLREIIAKTSDDYARYVANTTLAAIAAKAAS